MKLENGYKILYQNIEASSRVGYAAKTFPWDVTSSKITLCVDGDINRPTHLDSYKLIYERENFIYGSVDGLPTNNDDLICGLDELGQVIFGRTATPVSKHLVTISDESIEYRGVSGPGEYSAGQSVEVKFILDVHFEVENIFANIDLPDLVVTKGTSETEGNWTKATFTMPDSDVELTISADPMIKINTTVPYTSLIGFNKTYAHGTNNIYLRIVDIDDNYNYIAEGRDATDTDIGFNWQQKVYDMGEPVGYEMEVTTMPETDLTINFRIEE